MFCYQGRLIVVSIVSKRELMIFKQSSMIAFSALCLLSGCWNADKTPTAPSTAQENEALETLTAGVSVLGKDLTGEPLITMDGKAIVTVDSLENEKNKVFEANPQLKEMLVFMPVDQLDVNLAEGLMHQAIIDRFISDEGIDKEQAYKNELLDGFKAIERMVNTKFFSQRLKVTVSDTEVRAFYEENKKDIPRLIISRGGVKAVGAKFDSEQAARDFAAAVTTASDIARVAQAQELEFKDFGMVSDFSGVVEPALRAKILGMTTVPMVDIVVLNDKTVWVVGALSKEEPKYQEFDRVKEELKDLLDKQKREKLFVEEMQTLKEKYNVQMKEGFAQKAAAAAQEEMADLETIESAEFDFDDAEGTLAQFEDEASSHIA